LYETGDEFPASVLFHVISGKLAATDSTRKQPPGTPIDRSTRF
jgi:hypothetical protein